jgi:hypothetical protein
MSLNGSDADASDDGFVIGTSSGAIRYSIPLICRFVLKKIVWYNVQRRCQKNDIIIKFLVSECHSNGMIEKKASTGKTMMKPRPACIF